MPKLSTLFAAGLIALFTLSLFAVILSTPGSQPTPVPTPSPEGGGAGFSGSGRAEAQVAALSSQFLVGCNSSDSSGALASLEALPEFQDAFQVANELYAVSLNSSLVAGNESLSANASASAAFEVAYSLSDYCAARVLQRGAASFNDSLALSAEGGGNKTLFVREINAFASSVGSPSGAPVYFVPGTAVGETVSVLVSAQLSADSRVTQWFAQQLQQPTPRFETLSLAGFVEELESKASLQAPVAWEARGVSQQFLADSLNSSQQFSLESFSYAPENSVVLENASLESINASVELFKKQPFVLEAFASLDSARVIVLVQDNYSNAAGFRKLLQENRVDGVAFFPNSTISATLSFLNSSFEEASQAVAGLLGPDAQLSKRGTVRILERGDRSRSLQILLPATVSAELKPATQQNSTVEIELGVIAQGFLPVQVVGREV